MPNTFRRTVNLFKAATDAAEMEYENQPNYRSKKYTYHFASLAGSYIKVQQGVSISNSPAIRGAIAWAIRQTGRQVTLTGGDGFLLV